MGGIGIFIYIFYLGLMIAVPCIMGSVTKRINENKGYDGGFAWGFWLGWIGIIVVACRQPAYTPPTNSQLREGNWRCNCGRINSAYIATCACGMTKQAVKTQPQLLASGNWRCTCGRVHASYISTCTCGISKRALLLSANKAATPTPAQDEMEKLKRLKEYKQLLDIGAITQEDFDRKKAELLDLGTQSNADSGKAEEAAPAAEPVAVPVATESGEKICPKCGLSQSAARKACWSCGQEL